MDIDTATYILTSTLSLAGRVVSWGGAMVNPLDPGSSFLDWIFSVAVVAPIAFMVAKYLIGLAQGYKFKRLRGR